MGGGQGFVAKKIIFRVKKIKKDVKVDNDSIVPREISKNRCFIEKLSNLHEKGANF